MQHFRTRMNYVQKVFFLKSFLIFKQVKYVQFIWIAFKWFYVFLMLSAI